MGLLSGRWCVSINKKKDMVAHRHVQTRARVRASAASLARICASGLWGSR